MFSKKEYIIRLRGCYDETIFKMLLDENELEIVKKICEKSRKTSTYVYMPEMFVYDDNNKPEWLENYFMEEN